MSEKEFYCASGDGSMLKVFEPTAEDRYKGTIAICVKEGGQMARVVLSAEDARGMLAELARCLAVLADLSGTVGGEG